MRGCCAKYKTTLYRQNKVVCTTFKVYLLICLYFSNQANKVFEVKGKDSQDSEKGEGDVDLCYQPTDQIPNALLKGKQDYVMSMQCDKLNSYVLP